MKKLFALLALMPMMLFSQNDITLSVDMNSYSGSFTTAYVNGDFNSWCGSCNPLSDSDGDGIWSVTIPLTSDSIEYKFTLDGWTGQETLTPGSSCTKTTSGYTNRFLEILGDTTLTTVCWEACGSCATAPPPTPTYDVTFAVDMNNYTGSFTTVNVNGDFNAWCGSCNALSDADGDGVWTATLPITADSIDYKFTLDGWTGQETLTPGMSCVKTKSSFTNRYLHMTSDTTLATVCWESCSSCSLAPPPTPTYDVTFAVDMNNYTGSFTTVNVNGSYNAWCGSCNALSDADGDGVWTATLPITADSIEYKFTLDGWTAEESLTPGTSCTKTTGAYTNRFLHMTSDTTLATVCWESCSSCATALPSGVTVDANGCVECDSLSVGDFFVLNGDSIEVVDRSRLLDIVAAQGDLTKVCVSHVSDMKNVFKGASWFDQDISTWDVSNVTNMAGMFFNANSFNQDISTWDVSSVTNMKLMFRGAADFNQSLNAWNVGSVTNMSRMFLFAAAFDGAIGNWDVGNVNRMTEMFKDASAFDQDLSSWCVASFLYSPPANFGTNAPLQAAHYPNWGNCPQTYDDVTALATGAFVNTNGCIDCSALNIGDYFELGGDTLLVVDRAMLDSLVLLHADLSKVCVSNITDMKDALRGLRWFNTDISAWDVSNVTDMTNMFFFARIFNQDIGNWDVSNVERMPGMFQAARAFNQDIGGWDVSSVQRFRSMFRNADAFNQDIGSWDVSNVLNDAQMVSMFRSADNFSQDLSSWCVSNVASKPSGFDANSSLTASQLPAWGTCPTPSAMIANSNDPVDQNNEALKGADDALKKDEKQTSIQKAALFPNPTTGIVQISPVLEGNYQIVNDMGRTISKGAIKEYYDLSDQPAGIYILMLQTGNNTQFIKVIKL